MNNANIITVKEVLTYRQVSFDTAHFARSAGPSTARFFEAGTNSCADGAPRITEFEEKAIVKWLMHCVPSRQIIFEELGLPSTAFYKLEVVRPFYAPGEGDLDLILWSRLSPHRALALECKRVKIESVNSGQDRINKLQDVAGGVHQANKLYNGPFAFFQTYLAIITEVSAAEQIERNIPTRGIRSHSTPQRGNTKTTTFRQVVEFPNRDKLHADIGIVFLEVVQPSCVSIDRRATVRVCVYRHAAPRDQFDSITNRIKEIIPAEDP